MSETDRFDAEPFDVRRDGETVAVGVELPSGTHVVEWVAEAFPPGERATEPVTSIYRNREDALEATGGMLRFGGTEDER